MGAPSDKWIAQGEQLYVKRIEHYLPFEYKSYQAGKPDKSNVQASEAKWIQQQIDLTPAKLILLDQKGAHFTSEQFAKKLEQWRQGSHRRLVFLIGSAYGFDQQVYNMASDLLAISAMTLPHQICRLVFLEQLYRACTILKGESYHH